MIRHFLAIFVLLCAPAFATTRYIARTSLRVVIAILAFTPLGFSSATDVYVTPDGSPVSGSVCTTNTQTPAWFNSSANWGSGAGQIGPGTTVHLCGTFSGSAGAGGYLVFQGSGSSSSPITLLFESGAVMSAPYWSSSGAIQNNGNTWVVINGGTNGIIENTQNGTAGGACISGCNYQQADSQFVHLSGCTTCNIEVKNLNLVDPYVHTQNASDSAADIDEGIYYSGGLNNITIDNNTCHDATACIDGWGNNLTIYNNEFYNCNRCIIVGPTAAMSNLLIYNNHVHDQGAWDTPSNNYHHNGIHMFPNNGSGSISGLVFYNNQFDGSTGNCCQTAHIYLEGTFSTPYIFNNVCINAGGDQSMPCIYTQNDGGAAPQTVANAFVVHNTILGGSYTSEGNTDFFVYNATTGATWENNLTTGGNLLVGTDPSSNFANGGVSNNIYENIVAAGSGNAFAYQSQFTSTLTGWQGLLPVPTLQDANAKFLSITALAISSSTGQPQSSSPVVGAGLNLYSVCNGQPIPGLGALCFDKPPTVGPGSLGTGNARPASGAWDAGAYQLIGTAAPTCDHASGTYSSSFINTCSTTSGGTVILCWSTTTLPVTNGSGTGCTTGTSMASGGSVTISSSENFNIVAGTSTLADSGETTYVYAINPTILTGILNNGAVLSNGASAQ